MNEEQERIARDVHMLEGLVDRLAKESLPEEERNDVLRAWWRLGEALEILLPERAA